MNSNDIIAFVVAALILISCMEKERVNGEGNEAVVRNMFAAFNRHDWKAMASHYIDSASFFDPSYGGEYVKQSHDEITTKYVDMQKMFPDIR